MSTTTTSDIGIYSAQNGGDILILNGDINTTETLYQLFYLCLFGGNVESSTQGNEIDSDERFDYWANELLYDGQSDLQFNSETERTLLNTVLNSSGRLEIKQSVENDLSLLKNIINFEVEVLLETSYRVSILITVSGLVDSENKIYQLIWDNAKKEIVSGVELKSGNTSLGIPNMQVGTTFIVS